jgi:hypothetical protein
MSMPPARTIRPDVAWIARVVWIALPFTAATTLDAAVSGWSRAPRAVAWSLVAAVWTLVTIALLVPRPRSFTIVRAGVPAIGIATFAALPANDRLVASIAAVHVALAAVLALSAPVAIACADGASYGDEQRWPLRLPPAVGWVLVPLTIGCAAVSVSLGPLLLADGRWLAGGVATLAGAAAGLASLRSLATLERRFVVLVPAGIVVADSLTLADPVLFPREHVRSLEPVDDPVRGVPGARPGVLDLRLGTRRAVRLTADAPVPIPCRDGRTATKTVTADRVLFAPLRSEELLAEWERRRRRSPIA